MIPIAQIAPMPRSPVRPPPSVIREAAPQTAVGSDGFGDGPLRRAITRRRAQDRSSRARRRIKAPALEIDVSDAAPFLAQLLAQDGSEEKPADPFETAARAYEKVGEDRFAGLDDAALDAVLVDPKIHIDVKI